jgi:hypothetical protein
VAGVAGISCIWYGWHVLTVLTYDYAYAYVFSMIFIITLDDKISATYG